MAGTYTGLDVATWQAKCDGNLGAGKATVTDQSAPVGKAAYVKVQRSARTFHEIDYIDPTDGHTRTPAEITAIIDALTKGPA